MENIDNLTINCPACGSTFRREGAVLGDGWLYTCENCGQQSIVSDEMLERARQAGKKNITGQPLVSGKRAQKPILRGISSPLTQKTNPVIRNAELRAGKTQVGNPLIKNALKRAETKTEVQSNV